MFSIAYVILPFSDERPADAIAGSLARFQRGGRGDVPDDWIRFHDETAIVRAAHQSDYLFTRTPNGLEVKGGDMWHIEITGILAEMDRRGIERWSVRFAQIEPDLDRFMDRFGRTCDRHPVTGGYGLWLNPLGHWDWWDLGGRFDGRITGNRKPDGRASSSISSGPNAGRVILDNLQGALARALDQAETAKFEVESDANIELVSRLLIDLRAGHDHAVPGAIVLPASSFADGARWLEAPPREVSSAIRSSFGLATDATWRQAVEAVYARFHDHWAAGIAFHC